MRETYIHYIVSFYQEVGDLGMITIITKLLKQIGVIVLSLLFFELL